MSNHCGVHVNTTFVYFATLQGGLTIEAPGVTDRMKLI